MDVIDTKAAIIQADDIRICKKQINDTNKD